MLRRTLRTTEFPWTAEKVYLNNASIGPIPERTRRVLDDFNSKRTAPYRLPESELFAGMDAARNAAARLIHADVDEIALATNTSYGLHLAARALPLKPGDKILLSDREFPANVYPWLMLRKLGVEVQFAPCTPEGWPDEAFLLESLRDPKIRVLAISFVQFANGYRADLKKLSDATRASDTYLVVDGIQGLGNSVLDVRETPVDILACGGPKWLLSPFGSGFVYVRKELIGALEPATTGWMAFEGAEDFSRFTEYNLVFRSDARRFENMVLPFQDFYGFTQSVELLLEIGIENIAEYTRSLQDPIIQWADTHGARIVSPRDEWHRSAIVCIALEKSMDAFHALQRANVVGALREGAIRLSPHFYNTMEEMERVIEVLENLK